MKSSLGVLLAALLLPMTVFAQVKVKCSPVNDPSVPITAPGNWCLNANVVGRGVVIDADDVVLDLRGFSIIDDGTATQPAESSGRVAGVLAQNHDNITVRNGIIRGFDLGVQLGFPAGVRRGLVVEDLLVLDSKSVGISALVYESAIIRNNTVAGVAGNTARGINLRGRTDPYNDDVNLSAFTIENNRVSNVRGAEGAFGNLVFGILVEDSASAAITGNFVSEIYRGATTGQAFGIDARIRFPYTVRIMSNTVLNSTVEAQTFGIGFSQSQGTPAYTGAMGLFGTITQSRVYNFDTGITHGATIVENGKPRSVTTGVIGNNVVGGARAGRAILGGKQTANRIE